MEDGSFWNDPVVSQNKMKTLKSLKDDVARCKVQFTPPFLSLLHKGQPDICVLNDAKLPLDYHPS